MKSIKKSVAVFLTAATLFSLCSCYDGGNTETDDEKNNAVTTGENSSVVTEIESESESESETEEIKITMIETVDDVDALLSSIMIFKFDSPYAVINGARIDMSEAAIFDEFALFPADFVEEMKLGEVKDEDIVEKDGVRYTKLNAFTSVGKTVKLLVGDIALVSDGEWDVAEDIFDEYVRRLNNMYAVGSIFSAKMTGNRPVLFETDEMLAEAKAKAEAKEEPWYSTWKGIETRANNAIYTGPKPNTGASATQYRLAACKDMINARYLALAYLYTGQTKYLDNAVKFLKAYAEPMLGTDKYLDYSAPKGDGQADIGLNIAAPLTAACDVYSLIYTHVSDADRALIENWIKVEADLTVEGHKYWIRNDYYGAQYGNNHLTSHLMGIIAAAYVLEDDELLTYAILNDDNKADLCEMITKAILIEGDPVYGADIDSNYASGEIYDRYRSCQQNGFGYSMYHLKFLTHSGIMLYHNGVNIFDYLGENQENLLLSFKVYADYLIQNDITLHGGHYSNDKSLNRENAYSTYSIAYYVYKDETIKSVLDAFAAQKVQCSEIEVLGSTATYVFGAK